MQNLHLDFETYCDLDLTRVGIRRYVDHPSFAVLCVAWKVDGLPMTSSLMDKPAELEVWLRNSSVQAHAWNAAFETAVLDRLGYTVANPVSCTMQRALAYGLPASLGDAGPAVGVPILKSAAGRRLMLRLSRPDKKTGQRPVPTAQEYIDLEAYCRNDVACEEAVSDVIPELRADEHLLSVLDAAMNWRGIYVDRQRVGALMQVAHAAEQIDATRCAQLTGSLITSPGTEHLKLLAWLQAQGVNITDVARNTIEEALTVKPQWPNSDVREVMEIRLRTSRSSVAKLSRMVDMSTDTGQLCYQFQFCGAGRTGRWSGRGIQPQNLPRVAKGFSPDAFLKMAWASLAPTLSETAAALNMVAPAPLLDCVSWSLRSCLRGPPNCDLWGFDFSQIEARVLAWLAGQQDVLTQFRQGSDIYVWAAERFGSTNRQLGKVLVLALGFGMGATKLRETAQKAYGVTMSALDAERFKNGWRSQNKMIVAFWAHIEEAARQAIANRQRSVPVMGSGILLQCTPRTLQMRLPSGRVLYYHKPKIASDGAITYWGTGLGGRWEEQRTWGGKLAENATQAVARDVMSEAMLRIWRAFNAVPLMTIHDEIVYALPVGSGGVYATYKNFAEQPPMWAGGLPIAGEDKLMSRYGVLRKP